MLNKYFLLTTDVETTSLVNHCLSDETGQLVADQAIPETLELYEKYGIKSTFFITGYFASKFPAAVKLIHDNGHEIACHGYSHEHDKSFDKLPLEGQIEHLIKAKRILENIINQEVISFRAPALRTNESTIKALTKTGFKIDSSIASKRFDFFMSLGSLKKLHWLFAPSNAYFTNKTKLHKKGVSKIYEIPVSACIVPYIGTIMRIFPKFINVVRILILGRIHVNFLIHPIELINEDIRDQKILRRSKNLIKYLLSDVLRHRVKIKNIGTPAKNMLIKQINYFNNKGYHFITCKEFMERQING